MKKELTDLFKNSEISEAQNFNSIKITSSLWSSVPFKGFPNNIFIQE